MQPAKNLTDVLSAIPSALPLGVVQQEGLVRFRIGIMTKVLELTQAQLKQDINIQTLCNDLNNKAIANIKTLAKEMEKISDLLVDHHKRIEKNETDIGKLVEDAAKTKNVTSDFFSEQIKKLSDQIEAAKEGLQVAIQHQAEHMSKAINKAVNESEKELQKKIQEQLQQSDLQKENAIKEMRKQIDDIQKKNTEELEKLKKELEKPRKESEDLGNFTSWRRDHGFMAATLILMAAILIAVVKETSLLVGEVVEFAFVSLKNIITFPFWAGWKLLKVLRIL